MSNTPDPKSPVWLEASFRFSRGYNPQRKLAEELHQAGPAATKDALSLVFSALSNQALREVGDAAGRWMQDLSMITESGEELCPELQTMHTAMQVLCDFAEYSRMARAKLNPDGTTTFRRQ